MQRSRRRKRRPRRPKLERMRVWAAELLRGRRGRKLLRSSFFAQFQGGATLLQTASAEHFHNKVFLLMKINGIRELRSGTIETVNRVGTSWGDCSCHFNFNIMIRGSSEQTGMWVLCQDREAIPTFYRRKLEENFRTFLPAAPSHAPPHPTTPTR